MQILKQSQVLTWRPAEVAKTWPVGSVVMSRRVVDGETWYSVENHNIPAWISRDEKRDGEWSWALIEAAGE